MLDSFMEAYKTWPPHNQMTFAISALLILGALLFMFGWWAYSLLTASLRTIAIKARHRGKVNPTKPVPANLGQANSLNLEHARSDSHESETT